MRSNVALTVLTALALGAGCDKDKSSADPESGSNLLGPNVSATAEDDALGGLEDEEEDPWADEEVGGLEEDDGEDVAVEELPKLPKRAKAVKKCRGRGKKRKCTMVDPKPKVSAAYGVRTLMGDFRWGMTPKDVFKLLSREVEDEYAKRQKAAKDAMAQDRNRKWRKEQLQRLKANHTKFTSGSKHRWGVSLVQYEYEDDSNEEMLWVKSTNGLRKFYFFKDEELWKIFYAYSTDTWPGKSYKDVVEEKFKKWFGASPTEKVKQDPETAAPILRYFEWGAMGGETIRSFDMTQVHGVIALAVVDGDAEKMIGERLPNTVRKEEVSDVVGDVLGGSDVCYNKDGDISECSEKEAQGIE